MACSDGCHRRYDVSVARGHIFALNYRLGNDEYVDSINSINAIVNLFIYVKTH